ncbi:class I SAM-dependent methyltransferase [Glycomyces paridis]|uniref:Methyltransferase domain-containing protein n=1 Tax=Glycomyces paridis TaxID=2126555 RepID=A0A4S8P3B1_9ACTN|nr:class I SAM-dependent methyltransferase [Glycomyces paridis]THV24520.1 methyltransferase domain-containing protein [Glycomyces paridis]
MPHHDHQHGNQPIEGRHSRNYDRLARLLMKPLYRRIAADIAAVAPEGAALLDVGTGPGILLQTLARTRPDLRLTGVDLAPDMVDLARRNLGGLAELHAADAAALPFDDARFDLVVTSFSSHHWGDPQAGATEIARVLTPGGRLLNYDFPRAPLSAFTNGTGLTLTGQSRFRAGLAGLHMKVVRLEAAKRPR